MDSFSSYLVPMYKCQSVDVNYLISHIDKLDITTICFDYSIIFENKEGKTRQVMFNDSEHPVTYTNCIMAKKTLTISHEYYRDNKELIDRLIVLLCKKNGITSMNISDTELINDSVIDALSSNPTLENVRLGNKKDVYSLSLKDYEKFKNSNIEMINTSGVDPELEYVFDERIYFNRSKNVILDNSYYILSTINPVQIDGVLSAIDLENFKYIPIESDIRIEFEKCKQVKKILKRMDELGMKGSIKIHFEDKEDLNKYLFQNLDLLDSDREIKVSSINGDYDLKTFIEYEKRLTELVLPAVNLSPFEKYLYVYNLVKNFKEYKESKDDKSESRNLYEILDNEYMVCVGYSVLLVDLLRKLGIEARRLSVRVEVGLDDIDDDSLILPEKISLEDGTEQEIENKGVGHARAEVHLVDPKYGIDGYYIADATWDNVMTRDAYNHSLMTGDEADRQDRENFFNRFSEDQLFFAHSLEEFYAILNFSLDKNKDSDVYDYLTFLKKHFKELDKAFYLKLVEKYPDLPKAGYRPSFKVLQCILLDMGERIVEKANNVVIGSQFKDAIIMLYRKYYMPDATEEELMAKIDDIMEYNRKRQEKCFPKRIKSDSNDVETIYMNPDNKFDLNETKEFKIA